MRFTNRQILKITFPVLLSLMMEQLIGLTDTIYLGHVGEVELGASAIAGIFYLTIFMVGFGFSIGAQVLIARRNGEGNLAGIGPIFMQGMWFLLGMAVLFFGVSRALAPWLLGYLIESRAIAPPPSRISATVRSGSSSRSPRRCSVPSTSGRPIPVS